MKKPPSSSICSVIIDTNANRKSGSRNVPAHMRQSLVLHSNSTNQNSNVVVPANSTNNIAATQSSFTGHQPSKVFLTTSSFNMNTNNKVLELIKQKVVLSDTMTNSV